MSLVCGFLQVPLELCSTGTVAGVGQLSPSTSPQWARETSMCSDPELVKGDCPHLRARGSQAPGAWVALTHAHGHVSLRMRSPAPGPPQDSSAGLHGIIAASLAACGAPFCLSRFSEDQAPFKNSPLRLLPSCWSTVRRDTGTYIPSENYILSRDFFPQRSHCTAQPCRNFPGRTWKTD